VSPDSLTSWEGVRAGFCNTKVPRGVGRMNYPHVRPGWQFLSPPDSELRMLGAIAEITERRDDLVRVEVIFPDGTRRPFGCGRLFHAGTFAYRESA
jgi:hypothetical protein